MVWWLRSSVALSLVLAVSTGLVFCPCPPVASEHSGCGSGAIGMRELRGECCDEPVPSGAVAAASAPLAPSIAVAPTPALVPAEDVHRPTSHFVSSQARPLVLRI